MHLVVDDYRFDLTWRALVIGIIQVNNSDDLNIIEEVSELLDRGVDLILLQTEKSKEQLVTVTEQIFDQFDVPVIVSPKHIRDLSSQSLFPDCSAAIKLGEFDLNWSIGQLVANQTKQISSGVRLVLTDLNSVKSTRRTVDIMASILREQQVE